MENEVAENSTNTSQSVNYTARSEKIKLIVDALRLVSKDKDIRDDELIIPSNCEEYGFSEGSHNLGTLLYFLADMLEE